MTNENNQASAEQEVAQKETRKKKSRSKAPFVIGAVALCAVMALPALQGSGILDPQNKFIAFTAQNVQSDTSGQIEVVVAQNPTGDGAAQTPEIFGIEFSDSVCGCGHVNPGAAHLISGRNAGQTGDWTITDEDGNVVASGSGQECTDLSGHLPASDGTWTMTWQAKDVNGNNVIVKRDFKTVANPLSAAFYE